MFVNAGKTIGKKSTEVISNTTGPAKLEGGIYPNSSIREDSDSKSHTMRIVFSL